MSAPYPPSNVPPEPPASKPAKARVTPGQIAGAVLLIIVLVFIFENTGKVEVRLIIPQVHAPLFVALLIAAVLGGLGTLLIQWRRHRRN
jgi:uncharacterized integral membrane protein